MGKRAQRFAKVYREFTRVKFNKYKLQYPKVRQSELIAKILKEWEAMDENAKENLEKQYIDRGGKGFLESPSSTPNSKKQEQEKQKARKAEQEQKIKQKKIKKGKKPPSPKVRVFKQKSPVPVSSQFKNEKQNSKSPGKKSTPKKSSSSELAIKQSKKSSGKVPEVKPKTKAEQYHNFFKYYHDRLAVQHPRWTNNQISTIIKLLWKKRNVKDPKKKKRIIKRVLSGRQLYNRTKLSEGFPKEQIKLLWKALPFQSKRYWQIQGQGKPHRSEKADDKNMKRLLNSGANARSSSNNEDSSSLNWMNNQIK